MGGIKVWKETGKGGCKCSFKCECGHISASPLFRIILVSSSPACVRKRNHQKKSISGSNNNNLKYTPCPSPVISFFLTDHCNYQDSKQMVQAYPSTRVHPMLGWLNVKDHVIESNPHHHHLHPQNDHYSNHHRQQIIIPRLHLHHLPRLHGWMHQELLAG